MYTFSVMFRFLLLARLQWLEPAGRKRKSADIGQKTFMLIYPDPMFYKAEHTSLVKNKVKINVTIIFIALPFTLAFVIQAGSYSAEARTATTSFLVRLERSCPVRNFVVHLNGAC